jgi:hypothetical protein
LLLAAQIDVDLPRYEHAVIVVSAPEAGVQNPAGGASCVAVSGIFWLPSHPATAHSGRGIGVVVAKSADGVNLPVCKVSRDLSVLPHLSVQ